MAYRYPYIPSTISQNPATIGKLATLIISAYSSAFTHKVSYTFGSLSGNVVVGMAGGSYIWTIPNDFYDELGTNISSMSGTLVCITYTADGEVIGTSSCEFTASVDVDAVPDIDATAYDVDEAVVALTGDKTKIIPGYSDIFCTMQATPMNGSTITEVKISDGFNYFKDYFGTFEDTPKHKFTFYATDSRGLIGTKSIFLSRVKYIQLTCNLTNTEMSTDGTLKFEINGMFWNENFGAAQNHLSVQYRHREGDNAWGDWTTVSVARTPVYDYYGHYRYTNYLQIITLTGLDYQKPQHVQARAIDKLCTVETEYNSVNLVPMFDWSNEDFNFNVPVSFSGSTSGLKAKDIEGSGVLYGICETAAGTTEKIVVCDEFKELEEGDSIRVRFYYGNTVEAPTLNVNGTGAHTISNYGGTSEMAYKWYTGEVKDFVFDGSYWIMVDGMVATTAYYGKTLLTNSVSDSQAKAMTPYGVQHAISTANSKLNQKFLELENKVTTPATTSEYGLVKLASVISDDETSAVTPCCVKDTIEAQLESGTWTPSFVSYGSVPLTQSFIKSKGWYQRVGNVVTAGFYLQAKIGAHDEDQYIFIEANSDSLPGANDSNICGSCVIRGGQDYDCQGILVSATYRENIQYNFTIYPLGGTDHLKYKKVEHTIYLGGIFSYMISE